MQKKKQPARATKRAVPKKKVKTGLALPPPELFAGLFSHAPQACCVIDGGKRIVAANRVFSRMFGRSLSALQGCSIDALVQEALDPKKKTRIASLRIMDKPALHSGREGMHLQLLISESRRQGRHAYRTVTVKDLTPQKETEQALRAAQKRLAVIRENSSEAFLLLDLKGRITDFNAPARRLLLLSSGKEPQQGKLLTDYIAPERKKFMREVIAGAIEGRDTVYDAQRNDIKDFWYRVSFRPLRDEEGNVYAICARGENIAVQKMNELLLKGREEYFRSLIEQSADMVTVISPEGKMLYVGPSIEKLFGFRPAEITGMNSMELIHPDDQANAGQALHRAATEPGLPVPITHRMLTRNGEWRWTEGTVTNLLHIDSIRAFVCNFRDVSERIQAEEALKRSEANLSAIINHTDESFILFDRDLHVLAFNKAALIRSRNIKGGELREGVSMLQLMPEFRHAEFLAYAERAFAGVQIYTQSRYELKDGGFAVYDMLYRPIVSEKGIVDRVCITAADVTDKVIAEQERLEYAERLAHILESMSEAFYIVDADWNITYWNKEAERITERKREELVGKNLWETFPTARDLYYNELIEARETGRPHRFEVFSSSTQRWYELSVFPSKEELCVYFKDIAYRKRAEAELRELNHSLEKRAAELARSNADLEQFAYVASHDLQEPLRMVSSFMQLLEKRYMEKLDGDARQYIAFAVDGAERMKKLILDLLEYSRLSTNPEPFTEVPLEQLLARQVETYAEQVREAGGQMDVGPMPVVLGNKSQLGQLFQNLLGNALKYRGQAPPHIVVRCSDEGERWHFTVSDNGIGIDPRYFEKIFVIFQRLHSRSEYSGTGIGLAICKSIVERHGGRIWVESQPGQGCTFHFTLKKQP